MSVLAEKLSNLPTSSGVYIMKNAAQEIIYVGKAVNLKNRVKQYFNNNVKNIKVAAMVEKIADIDFILTPDEVNALVLENNLIKKHKPHYNILLKDDKQYPYLVVNFDEKYPKIEMTRKLKKGNFKYFGPYMNGISVHDVRDTVNSVFSLRSCKRDLTKTKKSERACLEKDLGRCLAPCENKVSDEEYREQLNKAMDFLAGNNKSALNILKIKMLEASAREDFESAIFYKRRLEILNNLIRKQIATFPQAVDYDIFAVKEENGLVSISEIVVRNGKVLGSENANFEFNEMDIEDVLSDYIVGYYTSAEVTANKIFLNIHLSDADAVSAVISNKAGKKIVLSVPQKGIARQLVDMAEKNAENSLKIFSANEERKTKILNRSLVELGEFLGLTNLERIECYDNSNISGTSAVSAMIIFIGGEPSYKMYRRFKVKTVVGANDYDTMKEVLSRRFTRLLNGDADVSFSQTPSLIILDGGKGQLGYGVEAMKEAGVSYNMVAIAEREELIYRPNETDPIVIPYNSAAFKLMQRIRDEAHRFAITYHRKLREQSQTKSRFFDIEGIGKVREKKLMKTFKTIDSIQKASIEDIVKIGIPKAVAEKIKEKCK